MTDRFRRRRRRLFLALELLVLGRTRSVLSLRSHPLPLNKAASATCEPSGPRSESSLARRTALILFLFQSRKSWPAKSELSWDPIESGSNAGFLSLRGKTAGLLVSEIAGHRSQIALSTNPACSSLAQTRRPSSSGIVSGHTRSPLNANSPGLRPYRARDSTAPQGFQRGGHRRQLERRASGGRRGEFGGAVV